VPVIVGSRGSDLRWVKDRFTRFFVRKTLLNSAAVLTVSGELRDQAIRFGASPSRVHTILNGCDSSVFHYRSRPEVRSRLGIPSSARLVLFVGRISAAKGLRDLVRALAIAGRRDPHLRLCCIGAGNFEYGEFEKDLRAEIAALQLNSHVEFLGVKTPPEVADWLAAANVLCLPSHTEGCPNVVIEALSCGTPVVGTTVGGIPELVRDGETGILIPPHDEDRLATALLEGCARDWDSLRISTVFQRSWDTVGRETYAVCEKVLYAP
jgi:glycosyltransferase involved in cell wall biosynthesis